MNELLAAGEQIIWRGRPASARGFLRSMDLFLIFFFGFAILFFVTAVGASQTRSGSSADFSIAFLFPLVVFTAFFFLPRAFSVWREMVGAEYTLTSRRVMIASRKGRIELDLRSLPHLELERSWLSGSTIFFAQRNLYEGWGFYGGSNAPAFRGLADAEQVYQAITKARMEALGI